MAPEEPDCRELTDAQLVAHILGARDGANRDVTCQALFWRYYDRFDRWVREVLAAYGKTYSDQQRYYEEVFLRLYGRVFEPAALTRLLQTFDPQRRFLPWLRQVVRNRTIDWVRTQGARPLEVAVEDLARHRAPAAPPTGAPQPFVDRLNGLPENERLSVRLSLAAYLDLEPEDLRVLGERRGRPPETVEREVAALRDRLRDAPRYADSLGAEDALGVLEYQVRVLDQRCSETRHGLIRSGVSPGAVAALEEEAEGMRLSDLAAGAPPPLTRAGQSGSLASQAVAYQEAVIRLGRLRRRLDQQRDLVRRGRHLARASYRDVARIMGVKETDVTNFLHRARDRLAPADAND